MLRKRDRRCRRRLRAALIDVDRGFNARLQLAPHDDNAIASESAGVRVQFDLASAQRARGLAIDWVDDERGRGLVIDNPNAPPKVRNADAGAGRRAGARRHADHRRRAPGRRARAGLAGHRPRTFDDGPDAIEALPKDTPLAFLCHHGGRSEQAAEQFRALGFTKVHNITGGIDAWAQHVDGSDRHVLMKIDMSSPAHRRRASSRRRLGAGVA